MSRPNGFMFTTSQKKGLLWLAFVLLCGIGVLVASRVMYRNPSYAISDFSQQFASPTVPAPESRTRLDINLADSSAWASLPGIGPVLSKRIIKYRTALGGFHEVAQVKLVYGLSEETFARIEGQLYLNSLTAPKSSKTTHNRSRRSKASIPRLELNQASANELLQLPGIGPTLSRRIVRYREAIGGFDRVDQLAKVYQLPAKTLEQIRPYLYLTPAPTAKAETPAEDPLVITDLSGKAPLSRGVEARLRKAPPSPIDLNLADSAQLVALPGIGPKLAPRIIRFRGLMGFFTSVEQLKHVYGLSMQNYERMAPYLFVDQVEAFPKRDLNQISARKLAFYPFIEEPVAEALVRYRQQLGRFDRWEEVMESPGMKPEIISALKLYFSL